MPLAITVDECEGGTLLHDLKVQSGDLLRRAPQRDTSDLMRNTPRDEKLPPAPSSLDAARVVAQAQ